jgi:hypothetical protein
MAELKKIVGELKNKGESKGRWTLEIDCGTKFTTKISTFSTIGKNDPRPNPLLEQIEAVKPGMKVEVVYVENPGKNAQGGDVTYKNLYGISIATDATPNKPPEKSAPADGQTAAKPAETHREYESVEEKRNAIAWTSCFNNAVVLYAPLMLHDYTESKNLDSEEMNRHLKNIDALASGLYDYLITSIKGIK